MKKLLYILALLTVTYSCKTTQDLGVITPQEVVVNIDLVNVKDDRVMVTIDPGKFTDTIATFYFPNTVPGTYSLDNYGTLIEDFKAYDYLGKEMLFERTEDNSWVIENSQELDKITYWVNDSFDIEGELGIFSPAGTNIEKDETFMLNLHGFVGYFEQLQEQPYKLVIERPEHLFAGTAMPLSRTLQRNNMAHMTDTYMANRYFDIIDNPIMYAAPDTTFVRAEGIEVLIQVYSPNNVHNAQSIKPGIQEMITAQKTFLGDIDDTPNYAILLYLSNTEDIDARGYGALEHHTSTVVVLPETMPLESLNQTMTDVVSHEFFHILTPLNIHSKEIHYFDYNDPQMSQHLWMYEGVTEYFAHLFQVNQGLIDANEFYKRMSDKIETAQNYDDTMPFTELSKNVLEEPYKSEYYNVYLKGALIGMALDIKLRELSKGKNGILNLMKSLSERYGKDRPFDDDELIPVIVDLTYPEVQGFFDSHVSGETPIPYDEYFSKVGIEKAEGTVNTSFFLKGQIPYIDGNPETGELFFRKNITLNSFFEGLGVLGGDIIKSINGTEYLIQNAFELVMKSDSWQEGDEFSMVVIRGEEEVELSGVISQPTDTEMSLTEIDLPQDDPRVILRNSWLYK